MQSPGLHLVILFEFDKLPFTVDPQSGCLLVAGELQVADLQRACRMQCGRLLAPRSSCSLDLGIVT